MVHLRHVIDILINEILYINLKKCDSCMENIVFLRYINTKGNEIDKSKVKVIKEYLHL
jgi:hypothetical protein